VTFYAVIFYILAASILVTTGLAVTRRNLVHAVLYLVMSFFGTALLFYLFGAPLLAVLEVIIYAGAIMVLFLFIVMMLKTESVGDSLFALRQFKAAAGLGLVYMVVGAVLVVSDSDSRLVLEAGTAAPTAFGRYVFENHWLAVEIVSLLLLIALIGVLHLGRHVSKNGGQKHQK
jgi:NADH-quinone oxidoreductase subunit J